MREVINISLPTELHKEVEHYVKKGGYASKSEFFRHLFRVWKEARTYEEVMMSRGEIQKGKGKKLSSLRDLR
jgi:Arc/MetJ-type ribon-helix-helix transcriptional regulator